MIVMLRTLRYGAYLRELKSVKVYEKTLKHLFVPLLSLFLVIYTFYLLYAEVCVMAFGSWLSYESIITLNNENPNISLAYVYLNMNDFASACLTLFSIMINNNW